MDSKSWRERRRNPAPDCSCADSFRPLKIPYSPLFRRLPPAVSPYKAPRNLQTSEPTKTSFRVSWDHAPGDVKGYKVTFHPIGDQVDLGVMLVGPHDNTIVLEELR